MTPKEQSQFQILLALEANPMLTQRQLAQVLGVSNGKVHYLMVALAKKGFIKLEHFRSNSGKLNKIAYLLTPKGVRSRVEKTEAYLVRKRAEYKALQEEIAILKTMSNEPVLARV